MSNETTGAARIFRPTLPQYYFLKIPLADCVCFSYPCQPAYPAFRISLNNTVGQRKKPMKALITMVAVALMACGCRSPRSSSENPPLRSEREYAENREARAQNLYRTGQASSLSEARLQAAGEMNNEWAAAARAAERNAKQEKFEKDLSQIERDKK